jgi:hypothetical protein
VFAIFMLVAMTGVTVAILPAEVNSWAYVVGADVTWDSQVPLGQPFSVRDPLWAWGTGRNLTSGDGSAIAMIVVGLFFDGVTLLLLYALVVVVRHTSSRRSQRMPVPV